MEIVVDRDRCIDCGNTDGWKGVMVFAQQSGGSLHPVFFEILSKAKELALSLHQPLFAVSIGYHVDQNEFRGYGIDEVFVFDDIQYEHYRSNAYGNALSSCIKQVKPNMVLFGATLEARSLAPYIAVEFQTGLTADCIELSIDEHNLLKQTRPAFGGDIIADIITERARPQMATVREKVMPKAEPENDDMPCITYLNAPYIEDWITINSVTKKENRHDIKDAQTLIVIGKGVKNKNDIKLFKEFASLLNGSLACSRGLVEKGWMPIDQQVGLSGKTVKPRLLIALGVSGSIQFQSGMRNAQRIISVNNDPDAPIHSIAHVSLVDDMYEFAESVINKLKERERT